ncbi:MAG TPA: hypothetical protein VG275_10815 [Solirubrobacteraceae bacterium]|nr:hypothetical protein [Solirubrobacteraceae bacterium]
MISTVRPEGYGPLARWSSSELAREVLARGICERISGVTVWRWLPEDAIKPRQDRSWIFPRDPTFTAKARRILDLYSGRWEGELLHPGGYVVCCDEKPSIPSRSGNAKSSRPTTSPCAIRRSASGLPSVGFLARYPGYCAVHHARNLRYGQAEP